MKRPPLSACCALSLLALSGCVADDSRCAQLPGGGRYCLQATSALAPFEVQQKVEATINGRRETMIFQLEVDADEMHLAGLTPFGQKLIALSYDNRTAKADKLPDQRLPPALLLSLLQLALWPADSVRAGLDSDSVLTDSAQQRRVTVEGKVLLEVSYTGGRPPQAPQPPHRQIHIALPAAAMEFEISTLDTDSTP